ncbi:MAG: M16 family metallopeptidase [Planctomycetota bacterium]|jgi:predicted Zn-dependent peptidase
MGERLDKHILKNGMVVLGESMEAVGSAAFGFMLPAGAARLPEGCCGACNVIGDWIFRGAGDKDSRQLGDALDGLGLHRVSSVNSSHLTIGAALEAGNLAEAIELYGDVILRSSLNEDRFEPARQLAIDEVLALDDDPRHKVMLELREQFYRRPLGRNTAGKVDELKALTAQKTSEIIKSKFNLSETIFAVAGKYDFGAIVKQLTGLFETGRREAVRPVDLGPKADKYKHIGNDGAQVHIGLMTGTVKSDDEDYYNGRVAVSILSGGMSSRLFTEVREKRGLCYAVGARYHSLKEAAGIVCYAGTTPDKAQETLDVIIAEFERLSEGVSEEEIARAKVGLKSSLILQSESSSSRASGIGSDYYMLGRVRSLDEIKSRIEQTSVDSVLGFLKRNKFKDFFVVTIGPREITVK